MHGVRRGLKGLFVSFIITNDLFQDFPLPSLSSFTLSLPSRLSFCVPLYPISFSRVRFVLFFYESKKSNLADNFFLYMISRSSFYWFFLSHKTLRQSLDYRSRGITNPKMVNQWELVTKVFSYIFIFWSLISQFTCKPSGAVWPLTLFCLAFFFVREPGKEGGGSPIYVRKFHSVGINLYGM